MNTKPIILASGSPQRKTLLARLGINFSIHAPDIDETAQAGESASALVTRLAETKATAIAGQFQNALIIGSDQVAELNGRILGKPGSHANAVSQLSQCSGRTVTFHTGLCVLDTENNHREIDDVLFDVKFRKLSTDQIERYVSAEQPYDSAGSFKSEALGITLFESLNGTDPTALIGLPLIRLTTMLANRGLILP